MKELMSEEIVAVSAGTNNWESIGYAVGRGIGDAAEWFYDNVMVGNPWDELASWVYS